jgi:uncharacterized membrane protein YgdD (TMEM256/DUF423 family)
MIWSVIAAVLGFLAVALGAFGAHALRARLDAADLAIFETAVRYQFYHVFALFSVTMVGWMARGHGLGESLGVWLRSAGLGFSIGTVIFSGSLYLLVGTGVRRWGMVTPIGGVGLLIGWASLAMACWKMRA